MGSVDPGASSQWVQNMAGVSDPSKFRLGEEGTAIGHKWSKNTTSDPKLGKGLQVALRHFTAIAENPHLVSGEDLTAAKNNLLGMVQRQPNVPQELLEGIRTLVGRTLNLKAGIATKSEGLRGARLYRDSKSSAGRFLKNNLTYVVPYEEGGQFKALYVKSMSPPEIGELEITVTPEGYQLEGQKEIYPSVDDLMTAAHKYAESKHPMSAQLEGKCVPEERVVRELKSQMDRPPAIVFTKNGDDKNGFKARIMNERGPVKQVDVRATKNGLTFSGANKVYTSVVDLINAIEEMEAPATPILPETPTHDEVWGVVSQHPLVKSGSVSGVRETRVMMMTRLQQSSSNQPSPIDTIQREMGIMTRANGQPLVSHREALINGAKNRYTNILPHDHTRASTGVGNGYINANHVHGADGLKFIAAQGPLPETFTDHLNMILHEKCPTQLRLAKDVEEGRDKCFNYWNPSHYAEPVQLEDGTLVTLNNDTLTYTKDGEQIHSCEFIVFEEWPDHGVAEKSTFMNLVETMSAGQRLNENRGVEGPMLVHCSAGVGRTGTFMAALSLYREIQGGADSVNITETIAEMRAQRPNLVQTLEQELLIYESVATWFEQRE